MRLHFTPAYYSWLNQVELWFAKIERDVVARGVFLVGVRPAGASPPPAAICNHWLMFTEFLSASDAQRVSLALRKLTAGAFQGGALTGSLAAEAHLLSLGLKTERRPLNDIDFVVESFASIPGALADGFLVHHIHPHALEGKTLLQLIDPEQALRIDFFRQFGATLARTGRLPGPTAPLTMISLEDLVARTTSFVLGHLRRGATIDQKHARAFRRLAGLGDPAKIDAAWRDHRQSEIESFHEAAQLAHQILDLHPELVIHEQYSPEVSTCPKCQDHGPFQRAHPDVVIKILGYW